MIHRTNRRVKIEYRSVYFGLRWLSFKKYFLCTDFSCYGRTFSTLPPTLLLLSYAQTTHQVLTVFHGTSLDRLFDVLTRLDAGDDVDAGPQCPLSKSHVSSLQERHGVPQQTSEHTTQPETPLYSCTNDVGSNAFYLSCLIIIVVRLSK